MKEDQELKRLREEKERLERQIKIKAMKEHIAKLKKKAQPGVVQKTAGIFGEVDKSLQNAFGTRKKR